MNKNKAEDTTPPQKSDTALKEEKVLQFWKDEDIFQKSLSKKSPRGEFVFYDGPPFATGLPHSGSLLSSVIKDVIPRYKTMRGYHVRRRWGWDTHGLPIESLVEKELGLKSKKDILDIGIKKFNETARSFVLRYVDGWKEYVDRVGRWVDFDNSYKTMDNSYIESVWWALGEIHKKGKLYEGNRVLMYCTHCETPLAKAEIAMDNTYKEVTEEAVTVRFTVVGGEKLPEGTSVLAWTTTPWTLPGNVALAVGKDLSYGLYKKGDEHVVVAEAREEVLGEGWKKEKTLQGADLIGLSYEPLYEVKKVTDHGGKTHTIVAADFVTTDDGTGVVHTAVMYGEDDYTLGQTENLPMVQLLEPNGVYNNDAPEALRGVHIRKAKALIIEDLEKRSLLFSQEAYTHSYPHCYRCDSPLIYNAISSWFINIQSVKDRIIAENEKINWSPKHLKHGRFGNNLKSAPDWTISRNRFWASPLPIWKSEDGSVHVIGSVQELRQKTKKSGNTYVLMRHGQALSNAQHFASTMATAENHLTDLGRSQAAASGKKLEDAGIDLIITTPILRAQETADIVAEHIGYKKEDILVDERMREIDVGELEGQSNKAFHDFFGFSYETMFEKRPEGGENLTDVRRRVGDFFYDLEKKYQGKKILIVAHEYPIWLAEAIARGADQKETVAMKVPRPDYYGHAEFRTLDFVPLPHNDNYELDLHRPYIDEVELLDEAGKPLTRIPEVLDCWFESGAMPFAEHHYPFENKKEFESRAVGDFIAEYIAQTRTWFYYMHALSVLLFNRQAFKNVVTTGNVLAQDGAKISKSKKNYTDPLILINEYGADAFRYYMMSSVVMVAEDMMFKDEEVKEVHNKVVNSLRNILTFYLLSEDSAVHASRESTHVLDRWIIARLDELVEEVTHAFDVYELPNATRPIRTFIDDFSTWYIRRSRDRMKGEGRDRTEALQTTRYVLKTLSQLIAPTMPFLSEEVFRAVREDTDPESVHLTEWPHATKNFFADLFKKKESELVPAMQLVRDASSLGLKLRQEHNLKVRQPLAALTLKDERLKGNTELLPLVADEVNVKEVLFDSSLEEEAVLDTVITPELKEEGNVREVLRFIQDLRKKENLAPSDEATLVIATDAAGEVFLERHWETLAKTTNLKSRERGQGDKVPVEGMYIALSVKR